MLPLYLLKRNKCICVFESVAGLCVLFCWFVRIFVGSHLKTSDLFYVWLRWACTAVLGLSPVVVSRPAFRHSLVATGFSPQWPFCLQSSGSGCVCLGSPVCGPSGARALLVVAHGLNCTTACGTFLDQGLNPHPLHWQVES